MDINHDAVLDLGDSQDNERTQSVIDQLDEVLRDLSLSLTWLMFILHRKEILATKPSIKQLSIALKRLR
jgi:hypothetical protein